MTAAEIRAEALARGYTHVLTYGGPVPIGEWIPYSGSVKVCLTWDTNLPDVAWDCQGNIRGKWRFVREGESR